MRKSFLYALSMIEQFPLDARLGGICPPARPAARFCPQMLVGHLRGDAPVALFIAFRLPTSYADREERSSVCEGTCEATALPAAHAVTMRGGCMLEGVAIAKPFVKAVVAVLGTMAGITATPGVPYVKKNPVAKGDVSAIVGVTGGKVGTIAVSFSRSCSLALVRGMLGDDIEDVLQDTQDAVGEITNMVSGQARASLAEMGISLQGSTPTVIMGDGHLIRHISSNPVVAIPFSTEHGDFTIEFCF
jgi:chemotaxis protein CheX